MAGALNSYTILIAYRGGPGAIVLDASFADDAAARDYAADMLAASPRYGSVEVMDNGGRLVCSLISPTVRLVE